MQPGTLIFILPETLRNPTAGFDTYERILGCCCMKVRRLGIGKERVRPPYSIQHFIADAQFIFAGISETEARIVPVLPEVEVQSEILQNAEECWGVSQRNVTKLFVIVERQTADLLRASYITIN